MLTFNRQATLDAAYLLACYLEPLPKADTLRARLHRLGYTPTPTVYRAGMALELGEGTASEFLTHCKWSGLRNRLARHLWAHRRDHTRCLVRQRTNGEWEIWNHCGCYILPPEPTKRDWEEAFYIVGLVEDEPPDFDPEVWSHV